MQLTLLRQSQRNDVWRTRVAKRKSTALLLKQTGTSKFCLGRKEGGTWESRRGEGRWNSMGNGRWENVGRQILEVAGTGKNEGRFPSDE